MSAASRLDIAAASSAGFRLLLLAVFGKLVCYAENRVSELAELPFILGRVDERGGRAEDWARQLVHDLAGLARLVVQVDLTESLVGLTGRELLLEGFGVEAATRPTSAVDHPPARDRGDERRLGGDRRVVASRAAPHVDEDVLHDVFYVVRVVR